MPPNPAQKVPPVAHRVPPGPHSRDVNSCPREREEGYRPIPPDLPGGYRPPGRLLLQLQRLSSVAGFRLTPKGRYMCVCVCVVIPFILDVRLVNVPAGVTQEEGHTGFLIHLPSAVLALIFLARRIQSFLSLVDREVEFCVLTII